MYINYGLAYNKVSQKNQILPCICSCLSHVIYSQGTQRIVDITLQDFFKDGTSFGVKLYCIITGAVSDHNPLMIAIFVLEG